MTTPEEVEALRQEVETLRQLLSKNTTHEHTLAAQIPSVAREKLTPHEKTVETSLEHFIPINTKRGKWILQDQQILARNVVTTKDQVVAMKVREKWLWSGRIVVVDKIVMLPHTCEEDQDSQDTDVTINPEVPSIHPLEDAASPILELSRSTSTE